MQFFYGIENYFIDVTDKVLDKCYSNDIITIPTGDHKRAELFGDPVVGKQKVIKIIKNYNTGEDIYTNNNKKEFEYGADNNFINITNNVLKHCSSNSRIHIPASNSKKTEIFGDPIVGKNKIIRTVKIFTAEEEIIIDKNGKYLNLTANPIFDIIKREDKKELIKFLKEKNFGINEKLSDGSNLLHLTATYNKGNSLINYLINNGININDIDDDGNTPLSKAITNPSIEPLKTLIKVKTLDPNIPNNKKEYPLGLAIENNRNDVVSYLFDTHIPLNITIEQNRLPILHLATLKNSDKILQTLIKHKYFINTLDNENNNALQTALKNKLINAISVLVHQPFDFNNKNNDGNTVLHLAALNGLITEIEILIKKGTDINLQNCKGNTALHIASEKNNTKLVILLLKYKANKLIKNDENKTATDIAVEKQYNDIIKLL